ncbi:MAG TPA: hypothetical protein VHX61_13430 [Rhizomicrobium sp.]|nr:hypothetical protein [Rhizomicrobium sp.]
MATTALVLCVSVSFAEPTASRSGDGVSLLHGKPGLPVRFDHRVPATVMIGHTDARPVRNTISHRLPNATFNNFSKDRNGEFLSWYGFATAGDYGNHQNCSSSNPCLSYTASKAIPITGTGAKVATIKVPLFSQTGSQTEFNVGIYSATPSGLPGSLELAGASTTASNTEYCCTAVRSVHVHVTLKAGQKYFLEVTCKSDDCEGGWDMEDTDFSGDVQDYVRYTAHFTTAVHETVSSPWHLSTEYPEQPAALIK